MNRATRRKLARQQKGLNLSAADLVKEATAKGIDPEKAQMAAAAIATIGILIGMFRATVERWYQYLPESERASADALLRHLDQFGKVDDTIKRDQRG